MKICIISSAAIPAFPDPNLYSGLEVVISNLALELAKLKEHHEVFVMSSRGSTMGGLWEYEEEGTGNKLGSLHVRETVPSSWGGGSEVSHFMAYKDFVLDNFGKGEGIVLDSTWQMWGYFLVSGIKANIYGIDFDIKPHPEMKFLHLHHGMPNASSRPPVKYPRLLGLSKGHCVWLSQYMKTPCRYMWNGIPLPDVKPEDCTPDKEEPFLLSLNRITDEKGIHDSINIAIENRMKIVVAGDDIHVKDQGYVSQIVEMCRNSHGLAEYLGSIDNFTKEQLLRKCTAVISCPYTQGPRAWIEGFGLNVTEGLAHYKPFIGLANGGHLDIIEQGKQGFLALSPGELSQYVDKLGEIDPLECRKRVEAEFTVDRMTERYIKLFEQIMNNDPSAYW
jgi:glycosyltransferase involved in cell wall biosynthesis